MTLPEAIDNKFTHDFRWGLQYVELDWDFPEWPAPHPDIAGNLIPSDNEYTYYIHRTGHLYAHLRHFLKQLDHSVHCLSPDSYTKNMELTGFTLADHLEYCVENYYIRIQSVYDRTLQLVNAVFNLGINEQSVTHTVIISNNKVERTTVKTKLRLLKRALRPTSDHRNNIIHRAGLREEKINSLNFSMFGSKQFDTENPKKAESNVLYKSALSRKTEEFSQLNEQIADILHPLFDDLYEIYLDECRKILKYLDPSKLEIFESNLKYSKQATQ